MKTRTKTLVVFAAALGMLLSVGCHPDNISSPYTRQAYAFSIQKEMSSEEQHTKYITELGGKDKTELTILMVSLVPWRDSSRNEELLKIFIHDAKSIGITKVTLVFKDLTTDTITDIQIWTK